MVVHSWRRRMSIPRSVVLEAMVNSVGDPGWSGLHDAYGSANEVPRLLELARAASGESEVWQDLWGRLCHQGTVYEASFAAIPTLAEIARTNPVTAFSQPLNLLAAIAGSTDVCDGTDDTRGEYADSLASCLPAAMGYVALASDDADFTYALSVFSGLHGQAAWYQALTFVADGVALGECPHCGEDLCLVLDEDPPVASATWDRPALGPVIVPATVAALNGHAAEVCELARRHGRDRVAARVLLALGTTRCPACGTAVNVPETLRLDQSIGELPR